MMRETRIMSHIENVQPIIKAESEADCRQVGGDHYDTAVQPWTAMESWLTKEQFEGFLLGNAIKYLARAGKKGDFNEDIAKAHHYLEKLLEVSAAPKSEPTTEPANERKPYTPLP